MELAHQTYRNSTHRANESGVIAECKDCHLPPGEASTLLAKVGKLNMVVTHLLEHPGGYTWELQKGARQRQARGTMTDASCLACHDPFEIEPEDDGREIAHVTAVGETACVPCHRGVGHRNEKQGVEEGETT